MKIAFRNFMIKLIHATEIGAFFAYMGDYKKTGDSKIMFIAIEESNHASFLRDEIMPHFNIEPNLIMLKTLTYSGMIIGRLCKYFPNFLLNFVASMLEKVIVMNYTILIPLVPEYRDELAEMLENEKKHDLYFKGAI